MSRHISAVSNQCRRDRIAAGIIDGGAVVFAQRGETASMAEIA